MSPSVQQLSVIGKDTETFQAAVSQDIRFDIFVFTPLNVQQFQDKHSHSLSAYSAHSLRCGSGLGAALCLPS